MTDIVIKDILAEGVALLTLNRPEAKNAFNDELLSTLSSTLCELSDTPDVRAVIVTGGETVFGAGGDLKEMSQSSPVDLWRSARHKYWSRIHCFDKPLIAAVNGPAYGGGCEFALACDIVLAGQNARFALPEVKLGFIPGRGGTQRLPALVNKSAAMHMVLTGDPIDADRALSLGLVWQVVPPKETVDRCLEIASTIASRPPVAVQIAKEMVSRASAPLLSDGMALERHCYEFLTGTDDAQEGMAAFLEKRPANFEGK